MRRATTIATELGQIHTVQDLTEVFESIASLKIAKIRDRVVASKLFFSQLWHTYTELRIDPKEQLARASQAKNPHKIFLAITSEGKLGGSIDDEIISTMLAANTEPETTELMLIGTHGLIDLKRSGATFTHAFHLPASDENFNVSNIIDILNQYAHISVFYQTYESLRVQKVARIELVSAVRSLGEDAQIAAPAGQSAIPAGSKTDANTATPGSDDEVVSSRDYIFEPNIEEIANYMESVMLGVALIQVIMESKLAQYASRFNAMNSAKRRAGDLILDYRRQYSRAKRNESDERLKEIMTVVKHHQHSRLGARP